MAAKIPIDMTPEDFLAMAKELRRLADNAEKSAKKMQQDNEKAFKTFSMNHAVDGLDSLSRVFAQLVSRYDSREPELDSIRKKIEDYRIERDARMAEAKQKLGIAVEAAQSFATAGQSPRSRSSQSRKEAPKSRTKKTPKRSD